MTYSSRFFLYAPFALFLALASGVAIHWWVVASTYDKKLGALNGHEVMPSVTLSYSSKSVSGFPFRIDALFTNFELHGAGPHGPFTWRSDRFAFHALTYGRIQDIFEAAGNQSLIWSDAGGKAHRLAFLPGSMRASAIADEKGLSRFDLDIIAAGGTDTDGRAFTAGRTQAHMRRDPDGTSLDLMLSTDEMKDAGNIAPLFGNRIRTLRLYAKFTRGVAFEPLLAGTASWPDAAAAWRAMHGGVILGSVEIASAGLNVKAEGFDIEGGIGALFSPLY